MPTRSVDVIARFRADTKSMQSGMSGLVRTADALISKAKIAGAALAGGMVYAAKKAVDLQSATEGARLGIATMLQQAAKEPIGFTRALEGADNLIVKMRKDAALLPGTFDEMQSSFSTLLPVLARAGSDLDQIRGIAAKSVVAARLGGGIQGGASVVAHDIAAILSGSADEREMQTNAFKGRVASLKELAKQSQASAVSEMERLLSVSDEALTAYAGTWDAQFSTVLDSAKEFAKLTSKPLYNYAVKKLSVMNEWLVANQATVEQTAKEWGEKLLVGVENTVKFVKEDLWPFMQRVVSLAEMLASHWKEIAVTVAAIKIGSFVSEMASGVAKLNPLIVAMTTAVYSWTKAIDEFVEVKKLLDEKNAFDAQLGAMGADAARAKRASGERFQELLKDPDFKTFVRGQTTLMGPQNSAFNDAIMSYTSNLFEAGLIKDKWAEAEKIRELPAEKALQLVNGTSVMRMLAGKFKPKLGPEAPPPAPPPAAAIAAANIAMKAADADKKPPTIDARNSNFYMTMNIEDGDPDRIALDLPHSLFEIFRPTLPRTAPAI